MSDLRAYLSIAAMIPIACLLAGLGVLIGEFAKGIKRPVKAPVVAPETGFSMLPETPTQVFESKRESLSRRLRNSITFKADRMRQSRSVK